jgi:hypothetical protein
LALRSRVSRSNSRGVFVVFVVMRDDHPQERLSVYRKEASRPTGVGDLGDSSAVGPAQVHPHLLAEKLLCDTLTGVPEDDHPA